MIVTAIAHAGCSLQGRQKFTTSAALGTSTIQLAPRGHSTTSTFTSSRGPRTSFGIHHGRTPVALPSPIAMYGALTVGSSLLQSTNLPNLKLRYSYSARAQYWYIPGIFQLGWLLPMSLHRVYTVLLLLFMVYVVDCFDRKLSSPTTVGNAVQISKPTLSWEQVGANVNEGPGMLFLGLSNLLHSC
jgi:hypothetical protein